MTKEYRSKAALFVFSLICAVALLQNVSKIVKRLRQAAKGDSITAFEKRFAPIKAAMRPGVSVGYEELPGAPKVDFLLLQYAAAPNILTNRPEAPYVIVNGAAVAERYGAPLASDGGALRLYRREAGR